MITMTVSKREAVSTFRTRLGALIDRSRLSQSGFAAKAGLDRSTLSQLMSEDTVRLPRSETILALASAHNVSIDWLLGLSETDEVKADIIPQALVAPAADDPRDTNLRQWHAEARGTKIRYVPSTIPDQLKTEAVIAYETVKLDQAAAATMTNLAQERAAHARAAGSEIEVCTSRQAIETLARGEGLWRSLALRDRRHQLEHMANLAGALYPSYRWFMFDARQRYAAPYTVFGQGRAAIYMGGLYLVFTSSEHIQALVHHFDDLIRNAVVQANETPVFLQKLLKDMS
jgi:transcriptional regulator with XRE-family HTH domain